MAPSPQRNFSACPLHTSRLRSDRGVSQVGKPSLISAGSGSDNNPCFQPIIARYLPAFIQIDRGQPMMTFAMIDAPTIPDLQFIPMSYAATRKGAVAPLYPSDHAILCRLQSGPATKEELLAVSGLEGINSLRQTITHLRDKLKPLGLTIPPSYRLRGHYALVRAKS